MNERVKAGRALDQLRFQTGLIGQLSGQLSETTSSDTTDSLHEAVVKFEALKTQLVAHLREGPINGRSMAELLAVAKGHGNLVISDYINEDDAERFRELDINYLDSVGNAYLNLPPVYVFIQGKKPRDNFTLDRAAKLFTESGLRIILALLTNDELLNASYRRIADHAGVSMGTIGWVLRELKNQGFTATVKGKYAWAQRVKLVKKWVEEYPDLRAKYLIGTFYTQDHDWWRNIDLNRYGANLGADVSVMASLEQFASMSAELFLDKHKHIPLVEDLNLIPAAEIDRLGTKISDQKLVRIDILNKFWGLEMQTDLFDRTVHPLLTYASLMDSWDPKSRELAAKVARQFL